MVKHLGTKLLTALFCYEIKQTYNNKNSDIGHQYFYRQMYCRITFQVYSLPAW